MIRPVVLIIVGFLLLAGVSLGRAETGLESGSIQMQMQLSIAQKSFKSINLSAVQAPPEKEFGEFTSEGERKSPARALVLSLLLPGAGQYYTESKTKAGIFVGAEVSLWAGFFAFRSVGSWKKTDYQNYAVARAGINPDGKDDDFYERLVFYDNRDEYNQLTRLFNGPQAPVYPESDFWDWEWDSQASQSKYRDLRNQSKTAYRRSVYLVGVAALNRIVSALDAFRGAKKYNRKKAFEQEQISWHPELSLFGSNRKIGLTATKSFY